MNIPFPGLMFWVIFGTAPDFVATASLPLVGFAVGLFAICFPALVSGTDDEEGFSEHKLKKNPWLFDGTWYKWRPWTFSALISSFCQECLMHVSPDKSVQIITDKILLFTTHIYVHMYTK